MSTKKRTPRVRPGSARAQLPEPRPAAESGTGVAAYDAFLAVLDHSTAPAPDDLPAALKALPAKPPLPLHDTWLLFRLVPQYQRCDWALRTIFNPLIRDENEAVWALMHRMSLEGRVPHQPDWYFGLAECPGRPLRWHAQHRQTGELIAVESRRVQIMEWEPPGDDESDVHEAPVYIDDPLCLEDEDAQPDRAAFRWMVAKLCDREEGITEILYPRSEQDHGGLTAAEYSRAVQRLVRGLWDRREAVAAFHAGWAEPARRVWLAALLGDWLAAHAAALTLGDPAVTTQTERRARSCLRGQEIADMEDAALETLLRHGFEPVVQAARQSFKGGGGGLGRHARRLALEKDLPGWEAEAERLFDKFCSAEGMGWDVQVAYYLLRRGIRTQEVALASARHLRRFPEQLDDWDRDAVLQIARHDAKLGENLLRRALRAPVEAIRVCAAAGLAALERPWAVEVLEEALEWGQPKTVRACCRLALEALRAQGCGEHAETSPVPPASEDVRRLRCVRRVEGLDDPEQDDDDSDPHDDMDPSMWKGEEESYVRYYGMLRELFEDQVEKARRWLNDWQSSKPWLC